ncbi:MAG: polysaccharide deacetylase family protein [Treponema sp.]|nr:polysaccharide deacetylase family protein [Treponema sp.]
MIKQSCKALVVLLFLLVPAVGFSSIRFGSLDLNGHDELLFSLNESIPGTYPVNSLFSVLIKNGMSAGDPELMTCYPERMELVAGNTMLQIRNRYGTARYSFVTSQLDWLQYSYEMPAYSGMLSPVSVSPDGEWVCFVKKTHNATGPLIIEKVKTGEQLLLSGSVDFSYGDVPVKWSPDSSVVIYEKEGNLFFCIPDAYFKNVQIDEKYRKIGAGTIQSVCCPSSDHMYYISGDTIYHIRFTALQTLTMYAPFINNSTGIAMLPLPFDSKTDTFAINAAGTECVVIQNKRVITYYSLAPEEFTWAQALYSAPFVNKDSSTVHLSVLWAQNARPVIFAEVIPFTTGKKEARLYSLTTSLQQFATIDNPLTFAVSPDNSRVAFGTSYGVVVYDVKRGAEVATLAGETVISLAWKNSMQLCVGGIKTIREWQCDTQQVQLLYISSIDAAYWSPSSTVYALQGNIQYEFKKEDKVWKKSVSSYPSADTIVQNGHYRVYMGEPLNALFDNVPYVRSMIGDAVTRPLFSDSIRQLPERKKVSLVFDAIDSAEGLPQILSLLQQYNLTCTFFINGDFIDRYPLQTRQIVLAGQECASLFYTNADLTSTDFVVDESFIRRGLARNEDDFYSCTGKELSLFWHAPQYVISDTIFTAGSKAGYTYVGVSTDVFDTVTLEEGLSGKKTYYTSAQLINKYLEIVRTQNGGILPISLGTMSGKRSDYLYENLELLINELLDAGFDIVPVSVFQK